ncbi:MAG TPA: DUF6252 family protein [Candidatus Kapabacteria bacterium]|nr:DUF6252 family protein [Candidatus Kapabacteria bacterium]
MRIPRASLLVILLLAIFGCSQATNPVAPSGNNTPALAAGSFEYVLNGDSVNHNNSQIGTEASALIEPNAGLGTPANSKLLFINLMYFQVSIFQSHTMSVSIGIPILAPVPGTFAIGSDPSAAVAYVQPDSLQYNSLPGGSVTITKFDTVNNLVSGTFRFTASLTNDPTKIDTVTSGVFNDIPIYVGSYGQGALAATADGFPFTTNTSVAQSISAFTTAGSPQLNILAIDDDSLVQRILTITIAAPQLGVFTLNDGLTNNSAAASYTTSGAPTDISISTSSGATGQLTITKFDMATHRMSGTFQFSGPDQSSGRTIQITNGVIDNVQWFVL